MSVPLSHFGRFFGAKKFRIFSLGPKSFEAHPSFYNFFGGKKIGKQPIRIFYERRKEALKLGSFRGQF